MSEAIRINLRFLDQEDRLGLEILSGEEATTFLMTRRVVRRLIKGIAELLVRSSAVMARAPLDMRKEVIIFEHLSATQGEPDSGGGAETAATPAPAPSSYRTTLTHTLNVDTHPHHFAVTLVGDAELSQTLALNRAELHRFLACLHRLAQVAEWDLDAEAAWLADVQAASLDTPSVKC